MCGVYMQAEARSRCHVPCCIALCLMLHDNSSYGSKALFSVGLAGQQAPRIPCFWLRAGATGAHKTVPGVHGCWTLYLDPPAYLASEPSPKSFCFLDTLVYRVWKCLFACIIQTFLVTLTKKHQNQDFEVFSLLISFWACLVLLLAYVTCII